MSTALSVFLLIANLASAVALRQSDAAEHNPDGDLAVAVNHTVGLQEGANCNCGGGPFSENTCCGEGLICSQSDAICKPAIGNGAEERTATLQVGDEEAPSNQAVSSAAVSKDSFENDTEVEACRRRSCIGAREICSLGTLTDGGEPFCKDKIQDWLELRNMLLIAFVYLVLKPVLCAVIVGDKFTWIRLKMFRPAIGLQRTRSPLQRTRNSIDLQKLLRDETRKLRLRRVCALVSMSLAACAAGFLQSLPL